MKKLLFIIAIVSVSATSFAYKNVGGHRPDNGGSSGDGSRAANCSPSNERLFMEFNNVRALVETGGSMWQDRANSVASYEVPKGSNKFVIYAGALWMGGEDVNGQLKLAANTFRSGGSNDFWAGPLGDLIAGTGNYDPGTIQTSDFPLVRDYGVAEIIPSECSKYDEFFTIRKIEVKQFSLWWNCENNPNVDPSDCENAEKPTDEVMDRIINWPAHGDVTLGQDFYLAPYYDADGSGYYNPIEGGDYPWYDIEEEVDCRNDRRITLFGDETHWWVFNDKGNVHTESGGDPIGMEIRAQAFAFATDDAINDMTFYNYELINRGTQTLFNTYFGQWVDADIGLGSNDYVGCDVSRGLGFAFNGTSSDGGGAGQAAYGDSPPSVGVDFFEGPYKDNDGKDNPLTTNIASALAEEGIPYEGLGIGFGDGVVDNERIGMSRFVYYDNGGGAVRGDPNTATQFYQYMNGQWLNSQFFTYGGLGANAGGIQTKYCFPGDSDPLNWGTDGIDAGPDWSEAGVGNPPADRRFLQAAGPFTLLPGAVNNITVGVVYGRNTNETDLEASVRTMKTADTKAQSLFDNCFELLEPPVAPDLTIQEMENELILYLTQPAGAENIETYARQDKINIPQALGYDDTFRFEGYQIFQMIDDEATVTDLEDNEKARLVAQCDVKNGVTKLVNYEYNEELDITIPSIKVDGEDEGVLHSFSIKEDLFASGDRALINHKKYYYIAVAYAYNNYKDYDPNDALLLDGQKLPYLRSRISGAGAGITSTLGIPHDPTPEADGTSFSTVYGYQPAITQIEGTGNGGRFIKLDSTSLASIVKNTTLDHPTYEPGFGPIDVKVVDPLNLAAGDYTIGFGYDSTTLNEDTWWISRTYVEAGATLTETVNSTYTIAVGNEQLLLDWGLSVNVNQQFYVGQGACDNLFTDPIGATITYKDSSLAWLTGVEDDDNNYPTNWIRSGSNERASPFDATVCLPDAWIFGECHYYDPTNDIDLDQKYEKLLNGTVAPFNRAGFGVYGLPLGWPGEDPTDHWQDINQSWFKNALTTAQNNACFPNLHDVDIIITDNKDLWTRCPVMEINDNESQSEHQGDEIMLIRSDKSVDKDGNDEASGTGMGWFPGYAVDVNTGTRLNMMFGENSWLLGENGADMIWNPTSNMTDQTFNPLFGGMHYVYVFGVGLGNSDCPPYDEGAWLKTMMDHNDPDKITNFRKAWSNCQWIWEPVLMENAELLATDVEINLRINRPYEVNVVGNENQGSPMYRFSIDEPTTTVQGDRLESALDRINVVPNPYYAYSSYETTKLDTRVKITNLPERCTVNIFNMQGALVRSFEKDDPITSLDWDLKNHLNVPIAGGLYVIHITIPVTDASGSVTEHERIIKWYGALRPPDLDNL